MVKNKQEAALIPRAKLVYLDNLRIFLTILVVLHHCFITYGAPGGWYFQQPTNNLILRVPMALFVTTNQSFFMGMFFFISAYFVESSLKRKGWVIYIKERFIRLGVPLAFYSIFLSPTLNYFAEHYGYHRHSSFLAYMSGYHHWIDFGVLWFLAALLIFDLLYIAFGKKLFSTVQKQKLPGRKRIFLCSLVLAIVTYFVRLLFPVGWVLQPLGFQLGHFPQYIFLYSLGIIASGQDWLAHLTIKLAVQCSRVAIITTLLLFPVIVFIWINAGNGDRAANLLKEIEPFIYSVWEQVTGIHIIVALMAFAKNKWSNTSKLSNIMSRSAFGVYIFHPVFVIGLALLLVGLSIEPAIKIFLLGPLSIISTFLFASLLVKVPFIKRVV